MNDLLYESLKRYFTTLSKLGYVNYNNVYKILVLIFIDELLNSNCIISKDDYKSIDSAITCLQGSTCFIPFKSKVDFKVSDVFKSCTKC